MVNTKTLKMSVDTEDMYYLQEFGMTKEEFDEGIKEAREDIENGRVYSLEEMLHLAVEVLEKHMSDLSKEEQLEAKEFIKSWRI